MSVHLVGGGWTDESGAGCARTFIEESAERAALSGRAVPRIAVLIIGDVEEHMREYSAMYARMLRDVAPCEPVVTSLLRPAVFEAGVLTDIDGLLVGGGVTPWYLEAIDPLIEEIRLLVADGLPYLGYSAGAMIAADRAIVGGWRINGVEVCPEETGEGLDEVTVVEGIALVDIAVDVHAAQWGTLSRLVAATEAGLVDGGVAIDERTALIVDDHGFGVRGDGSVWQVIDAPAGVIVGTLGG
ncbi:Type 1 glutamine amidotransferase-like domain-containing protein [Salinibacterium sp. ZJ70]|uniref:Type 1 glutamine amidotransferase-like domain-containing protein n=1 Tax=Salinibacterium sp. ZJ70 TaxID=2708084 RepID=UPI00141F7239|nr:Type 1 glutamine amidotransferase-like domain-containing protein [Salinibacterium sp. ZJ70]